MKNKYTYLISFKIGLNYKGSLGKVMNRAETEVFTIVP